MEEKKTKEVIVSARFRKSLDQVLDYGIETFGEVAVTSFFLEVDDLVLSLDRQYFLHPECRHLVTSSKRYRNIIIGSYFILYRVNQKNVEVLIMFHSSISPKKIKSYRKIKT